MIHKPNPEGQWRVLRLEWQWWRARGKWVWTPIHLRVHASAFIRITWFIAHRELVRTGMYEAIRLVAPDGTVAAEEYATYQSVEKVGGNGGSERRRIRWPKKWKVRGGRREGTP